MYKNPLFQQMIFITLGSCCSLPCLAYQTEINVQYENAALQKFLELDTVNVNGQFFPNAVINTFGPLAESAFLNNASNIGLHYSYGQGDLEKNSNNYLTSLDTKIGVIGLSAEYFIPSTAFYLAASVSHYEETLKGTRTYTGTEEVDEESEGEYSPMSARMARMINVDDVIAKNTQERIDQSKNNTGYAFEAGMKPLKNLLVTVGLTNKHLDPQKALNQGFSSTYHDALGITEDTALMLRSKYVANFGSIGANFEAKSYFAEENLYNLNADVYLSPTLKIGAFFSDSSNRNVSTIMNYKIQKFMSPSLAFSLNYSNSNDQDSYGLSTTARF